MRRSARPQAKRSLRSSAYETAQPRPDQKLDAVAYELRAIDPAGDRMRSALRRTVDELYGRPRSARGWQRQPLSTEKKYFGAIVQINLQRELLFEDGTKLMFRIARQEVSCAYSPSLSNWSPLSAEVGCVCLLVLGQTYSVTWSAGLLRPKLSFFKRTSGRLTLNEYGRNAVVWLFQEATLPPSPRVSKNFEHGRLEHARKALRHEGILILSQHASHCAVARSLGVPELGPGESVSVRVVPASSKGNGVAEIGGRLWRLARPSDPKTPAPELPEV